MLTYADRGEGARERERERNCLIIHISVCLCVHERLRVSPRSQMQTLSNQHKALTDLGFRGAKRESFSTASLSLSLLQDL